MKFADVCKSLLAVKNVFDIAFQYSKRDEGSKALDGQLARKEESSSLKPFVSIEDLNNSSKEHETKEKPNPAVVIGMHKEF